MRFYVASGVKNAARVNQVADVLEKSGHERTYDWTKNGDVSGAEDALKRRVADAEGAAAAEASLVVLLLPGGFGTHAELGMAIATRKNKRILLWSETDAPFQGQNAFCVFYHHPCVERICCPFDALLSFLRTV